MYIQLCTIVLNKDHCAGAETTKILYITTAESNLLGKGPKELDENNYYKWMDKIVNNTFLHKLINVFHIKNNA